MKKYMQTKSIFKSKTFWFNVIMTLIDIGAYTETVVPANWTPYAVAVQGIGNIILRVWFTQGAVALTFFK